MASVAASLCAVAAISLHVPRAPVTRISRHTVMKAADEEPPHVAIVGAGWGGWGAAKALVENGCRVTLLDGLPDPTGNTPYVTPSGKPFEAGTRGK